METASILSVVVAGVVSWVIGAAWYSPVLFSKPWQTEVGLSDEQITTGTPMAVVFGLSLVLMIVMAFGLSFVIMAHGPDITWTHGAFHGMMTGIFFAATSMGINYLYQRRSIKLYLIDGVYQVLFLAVSGAILAAMN